MINKSIISIFGHRLLLSFQRLLFFSKTKQIRKYDCNVVITPKDKGVDLLERQTKIICFAFCEFQKKKIPSQRIQRKFAYPIFITMMIVDLEFFSPFIFIQKKA